MMRPILKGSTDQSVVIRIVDSGDGTPETGVVFNTSGIDLWYRREGATKTSITEATLTNLNDAHSDGGVLHIGDGYYRLDLPDAAVATGANGCMVGGTVTGMVVIGCYVPLFDVNPYDAVRMGMTALPNAAAEAAGGLYTRGTGAGQINQANNGQIDANAARTGGTTNTGRDIGASVLLSSGTGTGQISLSSGAVLLQATQTGVTIPTVTTLTNAPSDSSGVTTLLSRLPAGLFTGLTNFAQWLGLIAGKQSGNSTARTELRATGAGSGTYDETTDSLEALKDDQMEAADIAGAVWDADEGDYNDADTMGEKLHDAGGAGTPLTATEVADAVWDAAKVDYNTAGTMGEAVQDAASAGDPWGTALPGSYGAGTAGKIVGDNLNATVSSRSTLDAAGVRTAVGLGSANLDTQLSGLDAKIDTVDNFVDTEVAAIKAKTDNLPSDPADASVIAGLIATAQADLDTLTGADGAIIASGTQTFNMTGNVTGNLSGSVGSVTAGVTVTTNNDKTGMRLSATGVDDVLDEVVLGSYTLRQLMRGIAASALGKLSGAATTTVTIRSADDTKDVVIATVDASGNRSAVTLDLAA